MIGESTLLASAFAVPKYQEAAALALALTSLLLGLVALGPVDILQVGRPDSMMVGPR